MPALRFRWTFVVVEALLAFAGLSGAIQLLSGSFTPPVEDLRPLGLDSWILPGLWLLLVVALPSVTAAALAARRDRRTPFAVIVASGLLLLDVVVQVPLVGFSGLQIVFGVVAVVMAVLAVVAHRGGTWSSQSG
jgi:hypothetical protein